MKKIIYLFAILLGLQGCEKEGFDYANYLPQVGDIDSVYFSTGSPSLIADGKATLQFVLEAYRKVQIKNAAGQDKDTLMFVDYKALPTSEIKIYADGQLVNGMEFSTNDNTKTGMQFYAQVGNVKSKVKQVQIRQPKTSGEKRFVNVVFHVFELSPTDPGYDPLTYQEITKQKLDDAVAYANAVFNNTYGRDPNGGQANVEFRLAAKNAAGASLAIPGYNKIVYDASWKASPTAQFVPANFTTKINATPAYQWNKDKFLNIYIYPTSANNAIGNNRVAYQIVSAGEQAIGGVANIVASEAEVPTNDFYTIYGLGIHRTVFFPDPSRKIEIALYLATYYGLYPTHSTGSTVTDYVLDTRKYLTGTTQTVNISSGLLKVGVDGEKFLANNAMDDIRYASLRNSFTQGQAERMRLVMERSPVRKAWSLQ